MEPMARAFLLGLERSNMFIKFFSSKMAGDDWFKKPEGVPNPSIWTYGHVAFHRARFLELLTGEKTYDDSWVELFELGCDPHDVSEYPSMETCRSFMDKRLEELKCYLEAATVEDLEGPTCVPSKHFPTKADALVHLTHHEAHHAGTISLISRLLGKEKVI